MNRKITYTAAAALVTASMLTLSSCSFIDSFLAYGLSGIFGQGANTPASGGNNTGDDNMKTTSFESIIIDITGTEAATHEYEVLRTDGGVRISYYYGPWNYSDDEPKENYLEMRAEGGSELYEQVLGLVNDCSVKKWDGFSKSASGVLDGEMFSMSGTIDGENISAHGSNAFPKGFREFTDALWDIMKENNTQN